MDTSSTLCITERTPTSWSSFCVIQALCATVKKFFCTLGTIAFRDQRHYKLDKHGGLMNARRMKYLEKFSSRHNARIGHQKQGTCQTFSHCTEMASNSQWVRYTNCSFPEVLHEHLLKITAIFKASQNMATGLLMLCLLLSSPCIR